VGISGEGVKNLFLRLPEAEKREPIQRSDHARWDTIGNITESVQQLYHRHHTFRDILEEASVKPLTGLLFASAVVYVSFKTLRFIAEGLISFVLEPFFLKLYHPLASRVSVFLGESTFAHDILIGTLIDGKIDFLQSFGLLTTGLFVPLAMVLPYIFSFYLILGFLEDIGYLPRLAICVDNLLHRIGLHGYAIVPNLLGLGCNVPGILGTRILESRRERLIACTLISIAVPCTALQAMVFGLVGKYGGKYVAIVYGTLFLVWLLLGFILNKAMKGFSPPLLIEVPPYRRPQPKAVAKKLWMRIVGFFKEALPLMLLGILIVNIVYFLGIFDFLGRLSAPLMRGVLGLPDEAIVALLVGILRKDVGVGMLAPLSLNPEQLVVGSVVLAMFFPCIATFVVLLRELGLKDMFKVTGIMFVSAFSVGGILNIILNKLF
jgi:ferrous iron transport protein B